ncbi:MAG TPA: hypothetical protein VGE21_10285 [Flavobacteriales bacterium]
MRWTSIWDELGAGIFPERCRTGDAGDPTIRTAEKKERYSGFVVHARTRVKFIRDLGHKSLFEERLLQPIEGNGSDAVRKALEEFPHITDGYIISGNSEMDTQRLPVYEALFRGISGWSDTCTLVLFGRAKLVHHEFEGIKNQWLSRT